MQLHTFKPKTKRQVRKRIGRGGKRGTTSGRGTKGQKSRAGASIKLGFRGGDNRIWQLFPKQRGASKKPGNTKPHRKHRFFRYQAAKPAILSIDALNVFQDGQNVTFDELKDRGLVFSNTRSVKILSNGMLKRKLTVESKNIFMSKSAAEKIRHAGGDITS